MGKTICNALEIARWVLVVAAFQSAFYFGHTAQIRLDIFAPIAIVALNGLTGIEAVFFGKYARAQSGYQASRYQVQSGLNNLALAIAVVIAWYSNWGTMAYAGLLSASLVFFGLSGINHAFSALMDGNHHWKNIARPLMSLILIIAALWLMIPALG